MNGIYSLITKRRFYFYLCNFFISCSFKLSDEKTFVHIICFSHPAFGDAFFYCRSYL